MCVYMCMSISYGTFALLQKCVSEKERVRERERERMRVRACVYVCERIPRGISDLLQKACVCVSLCV